jgi:DNA adenine methylase
MGGKSRIAKRLLQEMLPHRGNRAWVEPFVGGGNVIDKVDGRRIGGDLNEYLIALLVAVRDGWVPPVEVTREFYHEVKSNKDSYPKYLVGFVGFLCSFGGKWFCAYARNNAGRNYAESGSRLLVKQAASFSSVEFVCCGYNVLDLPARSLIYCDPPYAKTARYRDGIGHDVFFDWCRHRASDGHIVFVSEYEAPNDFETVLEIPHSSLLNKNKVKPTVEKLFRVHPD